MSSKNGPALDLRVLKYIKALYQIKAKLYLYTFM